MFFFLNSLLHLVLPTLTGTCDESHFYISVKYGNQGSSFHTMVGPRQLTPELAEGYNFQENSTHYTLVVPYTSRDAAFEVRQAAKTLPF